MLHLVDLPKVDLHVHLEGSLTKQVVHRLSVKHELDHKFVFSHNKYNDFFRNFKSLMSLLRDPEDYYDATLDFLCSQSSFGVIYTEFYVSISSYLHVNQLVKEVFHCIEDAIRDAEVKHRIYSNVIVDINRASHWDPDGKIVLEYILEGLSKRIVAIGLGGNEKQVSPHVFSGVFQKAKSVGLGCVAHSGETTDPESVFDTINSLKVSRIGHGVKAIQSKEVMELLKDRQIMIEICPLSEFLTGATSSIGSNPVMDYLEFGIPVTIGTDDQFLFETNPEYELKTTQEVFPKLELYWSKILNDSIDHSFATTTTKAKLKKIVSDFEQQHFRSKTI